jgi:hypothetical protein
MEQYKSYGTHTFGSLPKLMLLIALGASLGCVVAL